MSTEATRDQCEGSTEVLLFLFYYTRIPMPKVSSTSTNQIMCIRVGQIRYKYNTYPGGFDMRTPMRYIGQVHYYMRCRLARLI